MICVGSGLDGDCVHSSMDMSEILAAQSAFSFKLHTHVSDVLMIHHLMADCLEGGIVLLSPREIEDDVD